jgi:hypothetical protein
MRIFDLNLLVNVLLALFPIMKLKMTSYNVEVSKLLLKQPFLSRLTVIIPKFGAFNTMFALDNKHLFSFNVLYYSCVLIFTK